MPDYRRWRVAGGTYFFTVVTYRRQHILCEGKAPDLLREAFRQCRETVPFEIDAIAVLPDHLHTIWTLPPGDQDFSKRWSVIKRRFAQAYVAQGTTACDVATAKLRERRMGVWQPRFWERTIRDEDEFAAYLDYIHYNPVRHGWVNSPREWKWSSFRRWEERGIYHPNWGASDDIALIARIYGMADRAGE